MNLWQRQDSNWGPLRLQAILLASALLQILMHIADTMLYQWTTEGLKVIQRAEEVDQEEAKDQQSSCWGTTLEAIF